MKKICKEQYEKDFDEMFKLDKNGLMTDIDCYVSNLENKINNLQSKIDKVNELLEERKERVEDISWVEMKTEDYIEEINEIEFILKEDK